MLSPPLDYELAVYSDTFYSSLSWQYFNVRDSKSPPMCLKRLGLRSCHQLPVSSCESELVSLVFRVFTARMKELGPVTVSWGILGQ